MAKLILLTLPIGNIQDITDRVKEALSLGQYFASEDTRVFKELLQKLGISYQDKKIVSYHDHTQGQEDYLLKPVLEDNLDLYVVSDAGSPVLSDPAFPLVRKALEHSIEVKSFSGISSVTTALELSGLPPIPFHFHGFVPREKGKRKEYFKNEFSIYGTHIYFEGVSRVMESLEDLKNFYPELEVVVARELTKNFETVYRFKAKDIPEITLKGEFVVLISQNEKKGNPQMSAEVKELAHSLIERPSTKNLSKLLSEITGIKAKEIYNKIQD